MILVGDSSHALSGAFGSGAGFAMEDGWVLAQALRRFRNDTTKALPLFDKVRVPYYHRMYMHLAGAAATRAAKLRDLEAVAAAAREGGGDDEEERIQVKVIKFEKDMDWIYRNNIGDVWEKVEEEEDKKDDSAKKEAGQAEKTERIA